VPRAAWLLLMMGVLLGVAGAVRAENGWVRGAPLNLRSGPGTRFRILAAARPGDRLEVIARGDGWTRVRKADGKEGWIAAGYLDPVAPPKLRVAQLEKELAKLRGNLASTSREAADLRSRNEKLSSDDASQSSQIARLTKDNYRLQAGERWVEWLTGALILSSGMVAGAIISRVSGRRQRTRLRL